MIAAKRKAFEKLVSQGISPVAGLLTFPYVNDETIVQTYRKRKDFLKAVLILTVSSKIVAIALLQEGSTSRAITFRKGSEYKSSVEYGAFNFWEISEYASLPASLVSIHAFIS